MPIYEFRCSECNALFEKIVMGSADTEEVVCDRCGSKKVKKTISATSYRLSSSTGSTPFGTGGSGGCSSSGFS